MVNYSPKDLDLSACTVCTDGKNTSQKLSTLAKSLDEITSQIVGISKTSVDTKHSVEKVAEKIKDIDTEVYFNKKDAFTAGNPTILDKNKSNIFGIQDDGIVNLFFSHKIDENGNTFVAPVNSIYFNYVLNNTIIGREAIWTTEDKFYKAFMGHAFHADSDGSSDLGMNDHAWNNIYSKTAVSVTSDASEKKVLANLGDDRDADNQKLLDAIYNLNIHTYKLNDSINEKGEDKARLHNGFIAQDVKRVLTDAGLNPSDYGMWIQDRVFSNIEVDTGKKDASGKAVTRSEYQPVLDENGKQAYRQSLRYEEVLCVLIQSMKQKIDRLEKQVASLQVKNGK